MPASEMNKWKKWIKNNDMFWLFYYMYVTKTTDTPEKTQCLIKKTQGL